MANSQHALHDVLGEYLIADVYEALRQPKRFGAPPC